MTFVKNKARKYLIRITALFFLLILMAYWPTNIYDFPQTKPFSGSKWYNPYDGIGGDNWKLGNFHAHCKAWLGLSNGSGTNEEMYDAYLNRLNYDLLGISNYQTIDPEADGFHRIHAYEHGYTPMKYHHVVIGADEVSWKEYPLWQSIHHKQHVIESVRETDSNALIAIAHPKRGKAHSLEDIALLTNYDCIEAFNHLSTSISHWDAALSAGNPIYLLSDDDTHDHNHIFHTGRLATAIYLPGDSWNEREVVNAIKSGKAYAVELYTAEDETFEIHKERVNNLPYLEEVLIENDSLKVRFSESCEYMYFIGQNGIELQKSINSHVAAYRLKETDTYVRVHAKTANTHHDIFLNPVMRYEGNGPEKRIATVNWPLTVVYRVVVAVMIIVLVLRYLRWEKNLRRS